jgi:hypothetical protein
VEATSRKYTYYTNDEKFSKYLLAMAKLTHEFSANIFARLASQKTLAHYGQLMNISLILKRDFNLFD